MNPDEPRSSSGPGHRILIPKITGSTPVRGTLKNHSTMQDSPPLKFVSLIKDEITNWDNYPFSVPVVKNFSQLRINSNVCFFIGENGSGKSTLLEAIALNFGFSKEGGSKNINFETSEKASTTSLADVLKLSWNHKPLYGYFLRAESLFNMGTYLDKLSKEPTIGLGAYSAFDFTSPHERSHGELFLIIFKNQFNKKGFYVLDEPEAALSPQRQLSLLVLLHKLVDHNPNVQFIIATHSPILLSYPNSQIFLFDNEKIIETTYKETEIYKTTYSFLTNPKLFLKKLFN